MIVLKLKTNIPDAIVNGLFAIIGGLTVVAYQQLRLAILGFGDIIIQRFEESARIILSVKHEYGSLQVTNATGFLTIKIGDDNIIPHDLIVKKEDSRCSLQYRCDKCVKVIPISRLETEYKYCLYLTSYKEPMVLDEALPWTMPIKIGEGMDGLKYCHVTNIPAKGSAKLLLFDVYDVIDEKNNEEFYLIKVHSEYGDELYPRICLKLPKNPNNVSSELTSKLSTDGITFKIRVTGDNVRKPAETEIKIKYSCEDKDYVLFYKKDRKFSEILQEVGKFKLKTPRRGL